MGGYGDGEGVVGYAGGEGGELWSGTSEENQYQEE